MLVVGDDVKGLQIGRHAMGGEGLVGMTGCRSELDEGWKCRR